MSDTTFFAVAARGLEPVVRHELATLGARAIEQVAGGVRFRGDLGVGLAACLWLRAGSRVLVEIGRFEATDPDTLYDELRAIPWEDHVLPSSSIAVRTTSRRATIGHTGFATLRAKDAVVDRLRDRCGARPRVDKRAPDVPIAVHLSGSRGTVYVDLSRFSLHRRNYRQDGGVAPIKEHLAAGLLALAGFDPSRPQLDDPCCGAGTFVVEAALWALDVAPGLLRTEDPALAWRALEPGRFEACVAEAVARRDAAAGRRDLRVRGFDLDPAAVARARVAAERAQVADHVSFEVGAIDPSVQDSDVALVVTNPPYGKRLSGGDPAALSGMIGGIRRGRPAARVCVLLPEATARGLAADAATVVDVRNGPVRCRLVAFEPADAATHGSDGRASSPRRVALRTSDPDIEAFVARLRKRDAHLSKWARRAGVEAYRIYDADVPAVAMVIERYGPRVCVWEYAPPADVPADKAAARRRAALERLPEALEVAPSDIVFKVRRRARGGRVDGTTGRPARPFVVREGPFRFRVELDARLDTGLYLDHRGTRAHLAQVARGSRFLNLFAYTGSATVAAAVGGAVETVSVDLSKTYLAWLEDNLALAGLGGSSHRTVRADAMRYVEELGRRRHAFDVVFVDPPTFSASKGMSKNFDVTRDHGTLIARLLDALSPEGRIYFAAHKRGFRLDDATIAAAGGFAEEWTGRFRQPDFPVGKGRPPPHRLFVIRRKAPR